jgi:CspA family cold shock protein
MGSREREHPPPAAVGIGGWLGDEGGAGVTRGSIVSFDRVKGYGFVAPETGGEDVFVHVNDLLIDKNFMVPGRVVQFTIEDGERGPKASRVTVAEPEPPAGRVEARPVRAEHTGGDDECDVLSPGELEREVTERLLRAVPVLSGAQILDIRAQIVELARAHGWVDS